MRRQRDVEAPAQRRIDVSFVNRIDGGVAHAAHQFVIVFVAIGFEVEVVGRLVEPLVAGRLHILLHEAVIGAPGDSVGADRRFLGASRDLVRVLILQFELVDQRLLDLLVQQEIAVDGNLAAAKLESRRTM
jgi:hypothetical protein